MKRFMATFSYHCISVVGIFSPVEHAEDSEVMKMERERERERVEREGQKEQIIGGVFRGLLCSQSGPIHGTQ